jgi:anti-sigma regulatory factor (Ser/Thr protein kinase)
MSAIRAAASFSLDLLLVVPTGAARWRRPGIGEPTTLPQSGDRTRALGPNPLGIDRRLPCQPASVTEARRALGPLGPALDPNTFETLRLLVSELVTNSVRHAEADAWDDIELCVNASRKGIRAEVSDAGRGFAAVEHGDGTDQGSGWGLCLVDALSDRWGTERDDRLRFWVELSARGPSHRTA